ncbi:biotin/lipoyl-containing protein [uncultured Desulfosarcina sp.]|uniref:biotin/lipoyl-containing protein n=1 Tax=uncultured Desulfosarcina sp. TaxID=218289 RepID=UPI0029C65B4D|nr:biotin/lipoyl-containing protein [uncultured Desulfosarcina sp.]
MQYQLKIGDQDFAVTVEAQPAAGLRVSVNGTPYDVTIVQDASSAPLPRVAVAAPVREPAPAESAPGTTAVQGAVLAPIPGLILEIKVRVGDPVQVGQTVAVMEAMKMENNLTTHLSGVVKEILVQKGSEVATGDAVLRIG